ncbi:hypothetical protein GGR33_001854 [Methylobacterium brachythecii]|uniref:Uncharacterized protein n=1 Tax=Methylobacterium brachythecii TaxID=1176177 RepID=A0A7W6F6H1_9HYPH|nr:hypothetical protein [Methylobacterium brachythecii]
MVALAALAGLLMLGLALACGAQCVAISDADRQCGGYW